MKFSLFSAVLFSIGWMSVVAAGDGPEPNCCLTVTNIRIPVENIEKYEMQDPPFCNIRAVRFHTKKSHAICSDPDSEWAQRAMNIVDGRTTAKPMCYTSTTIKTLGKKTNTGWMSVVAAGDGPERSCCLKVTNTRVQVENIVKYEMQDSPLCNFRAVRFYTKMSKVICSDPDSKYAKRIMDILDGRMTANPTMCYTSTTNTIPTVTTTNKTPGTPTDTSTRNGGPESCCNNVATTTIPVKSILKNSIKSRRKKVLRRFQLQVAVRLLHKE